MTGEDSLWPTAIGLTYKVNQKECYDSTSLILPIPSRKGNKVGIGILSRPLPMDGTKAEGSLPSKRAPNQKVDVSHEMFLNLTLQVLKQTSPAEVFKPIQRLSATACTCGQQCKGTVFMYDKP